MAQRVARRPTRRSSPPRSPLVELVGAVALGLLVAVAAALLHDGQALSLVLPAALLVVARAERVGAGLLRAVLLVALAAGVAKATGVGALPSPALLAAALTASVAVVLVALGRVRAERDVLELSASRDPLTGLTNRRAFDERVAYEVARHARREAPFAVIALDLDGFKSVNDRFGHQAGDELLLEVAAALGESVREQDTVARLGGDEFCVLAPETGTDGAHRLAGRVRAAVGGVTAGVQSLGASVGLAMFPADGATAAEVLGAADAAAMQAKRRGYEQRRAPPVAATRAA